jgi:hypothetical protein
MRPARYAAHLVFGAHNHAFLFLVGVLAIAIPSSPLRTLILLWVLVYALWSVKTVYGGSWTGVVLRGIAVAIPYIACLAVAIPYIACLAVATGGLLLAAVTLG